MNTLTSKIQNFLNICLCAFLAVMVLPRGVQAQTTTSQNGAGPVQSSANEVRDYQIGPGDILSIAVTDAPEFTGKFRVNQSGYLELAALPPLQASGKTPLQLAKDLAQALETARLYTNPIVNVFVDEYHSKNVTVVGAVNKPALYPLQHPTSVLEVISQAGGLSPTAGNKITVVSPMGSNAEAERTRAVTRTLDLSKLQSGQDPAMNMEVKDGDVVSVGTAEVVYVVGSVIKPGGYVLPDQSSGMTALQALAMSQGPTGVADTHHAVIIRRSADGSARQELPIDMQEVMKGKTPDVHLEANDILYLPTSGKKQTLRTMGEVGLTLVNGVAYYGVGYRVGTR
jgi:polysaccharide export outer membrane protein